MLTRRATFGLLAAPAVLLATRAQAREPMVFQTGSVAINGADPVAYFDLAEDAGPVMGLAEHGLDWNGATWHFVSAENRARFDATPAAFAPAYGGYCAFAAARGSVAPTVPDAWSVVEGRLFLNYSQRFRRRWLGELPDAITQGDANYPAMLG